jgi:hypothetical protein
MKQAMSKKNAIVAGLLPLAILVVLFASGCGGGGNLIPTITVNSAPVNDVPPQPLAAPKLATPTNGAQIASSRPFFMWNKVDGALEYEISVQDKNGVEISKKRTIDTSCEYPYSDKGLVDNKNYYWTVTAINSDIRSPISERFIFTKVSPFGDYMIPTPIWVNISEDRKSPVISGDQFVILNWRRAVGAIGYKVYRSSIPTNEGEIIASIPLSELGDPPSNPNCPIFSELNPGYCDTSVSNGEKYYYRIKAFDDGLIEGPASVAQSASPAATLARARKQ